MLVLVLAVGRRRGVARAMGVVVTASVKHRGVCRATRVRVGGGGALLSLQQQQLL